jgi:hypothetical protein
MYYLVRVNRAQKLFVEAAWGRASKAIVRRSTSQGFLRL